MTVMMDTGNRIAAKAAVMAKPEVVAAYPITPQTTLVEAIAEYVARGEYTGEYICVESEHSAMCACIGASAAGSRTFTATSSHGLLLMHEMLHWAALARLPVVMCNINRVIGPGWNIWVDENDSISQRDTGWIQFYCSSNQEIFDTVIQAFKLAEHEKVVLPVMVNLNAFILSHTSMPAEIPDQHVVDEYLGKYVPKWKLDIDNPTTFGNIIGPVHYYKVRRAMQDAQLNAKKLIPQIAKEWSKLSGYFHGDLLEYYKCDGAEHILLSMGAIGAESKIAIDELQKAGQKIGLARVRVIRPFPTEEIIKLGKQADLVVIDRNISVGLEGALFTEVKAALYGESDAKATGFIAGLGGKDVTYKDIETMCRKSMKGKAKEQEWYGVEE
ncbi:MAG: pyruvate ferredoxin oxidoreductase [Thermoplasmata archaeon]|nr:pyruvate ferredoxin oxidoreductase [Thermoplasmata archaeon]MBE3135951.1 pyruvate ferredoxin oxidoreductase [Thermoplasmata archaeon]MBE3140380.1 pyruvate ferredoxin oxidoreductase [Thermoplasmata archaeon]